MATAAASAANLVTKVEISVSCRKLADMDVTSKSDPICVMFSCLPGSSNYRETGRTEMLKDTLDPDFQHKFIVDFHFEEHQKVMFKLYDIDSRSTKLDDHDFLGQFESTIGELVSRRRFEAPLAKSPRRGSTIIVTCLEIQHCKLVLLASVSGQNLDKKDFLGKSDPYFEIYKPLGELLDASANQLARAQWNLVYRSDFVRKTLNPSWQPVSLRLSNLCNGNKDLILRFRCIDWNKRSKHSPIGEFHSSVQQLVDEAAGARAAEVKRCLTSSKGKPAGYLVFQRLQLITEDSFIDFVQGGCELNFTVAIDFTASNGDPRTPRSLHYTDPSGRLNQYEDAVVAVGEIVQDYNSTHSFPAFGFGARIPPQNSLSHCFPLSFNEQNPFCAGVGGLLQAYRQCVRSVQLYGPTNFSPCIRRVMQQAALDQSGKRFWVLLIITDGIITDFYETKLSIIEASKLPMAVIIVGVGNEDFSAMEELDSDDRRLQVDGKIAEADIVQFVPLREFFTQKATDNSSGQSLCKSALAKSVLEELPDQLCGWMKRRGLRAGPPRVRSDAPAANDNDGAMAAASATAAAAAALAAGSGGNGMQGYPPQQQGYPPQQQGFPPQQQGFPPQQQGFPPQQQGFPPQQQGFPPQQQGFPPQQQGFQQQGFPHQQQGYQQQQQGYQQQQPPPYYQMQQQQQQPPSYGSQPTAPRF